MLVLGLTSHPQHDYHEFIVTTSQKVVILLMPLSKLNSFISMFLFSFSLLVVDHGIVKLL